LKGYFDLIADGKEYSGISFIYSLEGYSIQILEADNQTANDMLKQLHKDSRDKLASLYQGIWILHYTEECPDRIFD